MNTPIATVGYPEKFELALKYGEGPLQEDTSLNDSDRLLIYALMKQAKHGPCKEPRPSMWDAVAKAKWNAWKELGTRSKMEAMFMYVTAVEEFAPDWWQWKELGLVSDEVEDGTATADAEEGVVVSVSDASEPAAPAGRTADASASATHVDAPPSLPPPPPPPAGAAPDSTQQLAPTALAVGGWSLLPNESAPARYRHACAVVGARLFVFGGRSNNGRLATDLHQLNMLTGTWSVPEVGGTCPDLRWGHSMNAYRQWVVMFGGQ